MSLLCAVTNLLQFVMFMALTGILVSIAAAVRLMEVTISLILPMTVFMIRQSGKLVILEVILTDLCVRYPSLQYVLRPQYIPYLDTAGTVLLGWLIISWMSYVIWSLLAPVVIAIIAIVLICPITTKWYMKQTVPGLEAAFNECTEKFHTFISYICDYAKLN